MITFWGLKIAVGIVTVKSVTGCGIIYLLIPQLELTINIQ